jgi:hypothetical protein
VTTRQELDFGAVETKKLRLEGIEIPRLVYFLNEYLRVSGAADLFPGRKPLQLGERFMALVEDVGEHLKITPLLVKLFIDNAVGHVQKHPSDWLSDLPLSVPETFLDYLARVDSAGKNLKSVDPEMLKAARELANCSLDSTYTPRDFFREDAEQRLTEAGINTTLIDRLISNTVLEEYQPGGIRILRFTLDPLAEYLTALYLLNKFRANEVQWNVWLKTIRHTGGFPSSMRGFLVALEVCAKTYSAQFNPPDSVVSLGDVLREMDAVA